MSFNIYGTYKKATAAELTNNEYSQFHMLNTRGNWQLIPETLAVAPFRLYQIIELSDDAPFTISEEAMRSFGVRVAGEENEDGTTTIYDVNAEEAEEMIFDLSGRRVLETEKGGLYIINGKKVLVK